MPPFRIRSWHLLLPLPIPPPVARPQRQAVGRTSDQLIAAQLELPPRPLRQLRPLSTPAPLGPKREPVSRLSPGSLILVVAVLWSYDSHETPPTTPLLTGCRHCVRCSVDSLSPGECLSQSVLLLQY